MKDITWDKSKSQIIDFNHNVDLSDLEGPNNFGLDAGQTFTMILGKENQFLITPSPATDSYTKWEGEFHIASGHFTLGTSGFGQLNDFTLTGNEKLVYPVLTSRGNMVIYAKNFSINDASNRENSSSILLMDASNTQFNLGTFVRSSKASIRLENSANLEIKIDEQYNLDDCEITVADNSSFKCLCPASAPSGIYTIDKGASKKATMYFENVHDDEESPFTFKLSDVDGKFNFADEKTAGSFIFIGLKGFDYSSFETKGWVCIKGERLSEQEFKDKCVVKKETLTGNRKQVTISLKQ